MTPQNQSFADRFPLVAQRRLPFLPELTIHLTDDFTALWEALTARAGAPIPPPYWACLWPGGQAVARLLLDRPELVTGRRVLDVGSGAGAAAIAAFMRGARSVVAVDPDELAIEAVTANAAANQVVARQVDIEDAVDGVLGTLRLDAFDPRVAALPADVIVAGDLCYEPELAARALEWLHRCATSTLVLVGDPGRTYFDATGMTEIARYAVPVSDVESESVRMTRVYAIGRLG